MKYLIVFFLFLILHAKDNRFIITIKQPFDAVLYDVTQNYDRTISAIGYKHNYQQSSYVDDNKVFHSAFEYLESVSHSSYGEVISLIKLDLDGNLLQNETSKFGDIARAVSILKTPSNGYFIGGYTTNGSLLLAKLTSSAKVIFIKKFGTKNFDRMNRLIKLSDGGVLAVGSSTTSRDTYDPMFNTGLGLNDIFITRFSRDGKILWSKKYGTEYDDRGIDAIEAFDGSIIVLSQTSYDNNQDVTLMRISENGNKIWLKHYKTADILTPKRIIKLRDNNFLVSLVQRDNMSKDQIKFVKFDLQKNVLANKSVFTNYSSGLNDIKEFSNGMIIGSGYVRDTHNTDGLIMILDSNLNMICQEHFGWDNYDIFNGIKILHNSQAIAVGTSTPNNSQESNMFLVKVNNKCEAVKR